MTMMTEPIHSRRRNLLHKTKLGEFREWCVTYNYRDQKGRTWRFKDRTEKHPRHAYEVLRIFPHCEYGDYGDVIFYRRERGDHITCTDVGVALVTEWYRTRGRHKGRHKDDEFGSLETYLGRD